jgi:hypothetical protein
LFETIIKFEIQSLVDTLCFEFQEKLDSKKQMEFLEDWVLTNFKQNRKFLNFFKLDQLLKISEVIDLQSIKIIIEENKKKAIANKEYEMFSKYFWSSIKKFLCVFFIKFPQLAKKLFKREEDVFVETNVFKYFSDSIMEKEEFAMDFKNHDDLLNYLNKEKKIDLIFLKSKSTMDSLRCIINYNVKHSVSLDDKFLDLAKGNMKVIFQSEQEFLKFEEIHKNLSEKSEAETETIYFKTLIEIFTESLQKNLIADNIIFSLVENICSKKKNIFRLRI